MQEWRERQSVYGHGCEWPGRGTRTKSHRLPTLISYPAQNQQREKNAGLKMVRNAI